MTNFYYIRVSVGEIFNLVETRASSMSHAQSSDRTASDDQRSPDYYLPGTPTPTAVDKVWSYLEVLFRRRGRTRGERTRDLANR